MKKVELKPFMIELEPHETAMLLHVISGFIETHNIPDKFSEELIKFSDKLTATMEPQL